VRIPKEEGSGVSELKAFPRGEDIVYIKIID
jgi:hypothetical protein